MRGQGLRPNTKQIGRMGTRASRWSRASSGARSAKRRSSRRCCGRSWGASSRCSSKTWCALPAMPGAPACRLQQWVLVQNGRCHQGSKGPSRRRLNRHSSLAGLEQRLQHRVGSPEWEAAVSAGAARRRCGSFTRGAVELQLCAASPQVYDEYDEEVADAEAAEDMVGARTATRRSSPSTISE